MSQFLKTFIILCLAIVAHSFTTPIYGRKLLVENRDLKLCVTRKVELDKCNDIRQVLLDNKYEFGLECYLNSVDVCIEKVKEGQCDFVILEYQDEIAARNLGLRPYLYEDYSKDSYIVAVADQDITVDDIRMRPVDFDVDDERAMRAVRFFNSIRQERKTCDRVLPVRDERSIRFMRSNHLREYDLMGKVLVCPDFKVRDVSLFEKCNFDTGSVRTIYGRDIDDDRLYFVNYFYQILNLFKGKVRFPLQDELKLFGEYRGLRNVLFDDDASGFTMVRRFRNGVDEFKLNQILCQYQDEYRPMNSGVERYSRDLEMTTLPQTYYNGQYMDRQLPVNGVDESYRPYLDYYRYRQYLNEGRYKPYSDLGLYRRQLWSDLRTPQYYGNLDNDDLQYYDMNRVRRDVTAYDRPVYDFNRYDLPLSDANRFRQILNLDQYRQPYTYPQFYRPDLPINRETIPTNYRPFYYYDAKNQIYDDTNQYRQYPVQANEYPRYLNTDTYRPYLQTDIMNRQNYGNDVDYRKYLDDSARYNVYRPNLYAGVYQNDWEQVRDTKDSKGMFDRKDWSGDSAEKERSSVKKDRKAMDSKRSKD